MVSSALIRADEINAINYEWTIAICTTDSDVPALTGMQAAANVKITIFFTFFCRKRQKRNPTKRCLKRFVSFLHFRF